jgi:hypothetical protein
MSARVCDGGDGDKSARPDGVRVSLIRTALEMLEDTLRREDAEELEEVQALFRRLPAT